MVKQFSRSIQYHEYGDGQSEESTLPPDTLILIRDVLFEGGEIHLVFSLMENKSWFADKRFIAGFELL